MSNTNNWMVGAVLLDGQGGANILNEEQIKTWQPQEGILWTHLNLSHPKAISFLKKDTMLDSWTKETLMNTNQSRPRSLIHKNGLLLVIRTVNLTPRSEPDDMVFLRLWATKERIITVRVHPAISFKEIMNDFHEHSGPKNTNELIEVILENTLNSTTDTISDLEEYLDEIEEKIISHHISMKLSDELSELMRRLVIMHRFLMPEREALDTLSRHPLPWFDKTMSHITKDSFHRMQRIVEDISLLKERIRINQDAINQYDVKQSQKNMYMLSVIATIFLPLSFLTGLFGMNVGGIPFSEEPYGLAITVGFITFIGGVLAYLFKRVGWL